MTSRPATQDVIRRDKTARYLGYIVPLSRWWMTMTMTMTMTIDDWRLIKFVDAFGFDPSTRWYLFYLLLQSRLVLCLFLSCPLLSPPLPSSPFFSLPLPSSPPSYHSFYLLAEFRSLVHRLQTSDISKPSPKTLVSRFSPNITTELSTQYLYIFLQISLLTFYKNFYRLQSTKDYLLDLQSTPQLP